MEHCFLALPADVPLFAPLFEYFEALSVTGGGGSTSKIYTCSRSGVLETLRIRLAQVCVSTACAALHRTDARHRQLEDFDDLQTVLSGQAASLTHRYGEFFLADLIDSQDADNKALVAEVAGRVVGLLCASRKFDLHALQGSFDSSPFGFFMRDDGAASLSRMAARLTMPARRGAECVHGDAVLHGGAGRGAVRRVPSRTSVRVCACAHAILTPATPPGDV
jgi:hypothetical protein